MPAMTGRRSRLTLSTKGTGRIVLSAWKRPEAGDENGRGHLNAEQLGDFFDRQHWRQLSGGDLRLRLPQFRAD